MKDGEQRYCEIKVKGYWERVAIEQALLLSPDRRMRCPICHGRVQIGAKNSAEAVIEHHDKSPGCYLTEEFDGNPRPHPKAMK
jgi:hypothetical protein